MGYRNTSLVPNEFYHIYNRGNSKQNIFLDNADYLRFQDLLYLANSKEPISVRDARQNGVYEVQREGLLAAIGAYCLMPNHFHILLTPLVENGVTIFMKKVSTGYAMYFNKRYVRTGGLFEGRFKSQGADSDEYLKYLFSYIHLNPLKLKYKDWKTRATAQSDLLQEAYEYRHSSFKDYLNEDSRSESMILSKDMFPEYFADAEAWKTEMTEWITFPVEGK